MSAPCCLYLGESTEMLEKGIEIVFWVNGVVHYLSFSTTRKERSRKHQQLSARQHCRLPATWRWTKQLFGVFALYVYSLYRSVMSYCIPVLFFAIEQKQWMVSMCLHRQNIVSKAFKPSQEKTLHTLHFHWKCYHFLSGIKWSKLLNKR